ncbi:hypothetical protein I312_101868 [Cryptococcus bacillisporus CA1280]|uniref:uncharacterized protein n=1 Tax=Cryptococcus bacillisporus CA1280 TaxID=1296109 RepID=UPI0033663303
MCLAPLYSSLNRRAAPRSSLGSLLDGGHIVSEGSIRRLSTSCEQPGIAGLSERLTEAEAPAAGGSKGELDISDNERGEIIVGFTWGLQCALVRKLYLPFALCFRSSLLRHVNALS